MIRLHLFADEIKTDALAIWKRLKLRRYTLAREGARTVMYSFHWLWFAVSFERDIAKTKWKDLYKETTDNE